MSETTVLGVVGIVGTLAGVLIGHWLQESAETRRRLRDACEQVIAVCLEAVAQLHLIEAEQTGGPPAPPLREELIRDSFVAMARVGLASPRLSAATAALSTVMQAAAGGQAKVTAEERAPGRQAAMDAISAFQLAASRELGRHWWNR